MTPDEVRQIIRDELANLIKVDRFVFDKHIQILDARHIQVGKTNGLKIGTETTQKLGFYGVAPVVQAGAISAPSGGGANAGDAVDQTGRSAINAIRTALTNMGITA